MRTSLILNLIQSIVPLECICVVLLPPITQKLLIASIRANLGTELGYTELTQTVKGHDLEHTSRQSQNK